MKNLFINWISVFATLFIICISYAAIQSYGTPILTRISFSALISLLLSVPITWAFTSSRKNKFANKIMEVVDSASKNMP